MSELTCDTLHADWGALRPDLITSRETTAQGERILIHNPTTGKTFLFSESAFRVLLCLRAGVPARDAIAAAFPTSGIEAAPATAKLISHAHTASLLTGAPSAPLPTKIARAAAFNPFYIRVPILNPQPAVALLRPVARFLFNPGVVLSWLALAVVMIVSVYLSWNSYFFEFLIFKDFAWWPAVYVILALSALLHETAHVMMCDRFGVAVNQVGLLFYFFQPGAYADVSGAWMLPQRRKRIAIAIAGVYVEGILWVLSNLIWFATPPGAAHQIALVFGLCVGARIFMNLIPFLRLDGYWILSDWIGMPNLRSSSFVYLASLIPGMTSSVSLRARVTRNQTRVLLVYGSVALLFIGLAIFTAYRSVSAWVESVWPGQSHLAIWPLGIAVASFAAVNLWARWLTGARKRRENSIPDGNKTGCRS